MLKKIKLPILLGLLAIGAISVLLIALIAQNNLKTGTNAASDNSLFLAATVTVPPSPTILPPTVIPATPVLPPHLAPTATPNLAEWIENPAIQSGPGVKLRRTTQAPLISKEEALQAIYNFGIPFAVEMGKNAKAYYGIGTIGFSMDTSKLTNSQGTPVSGDCKDWAGICNFPIQECTNGKCVPTGKFIGRLENRPMWFIEYNMESTIQYSNAGGGIIGSNAGGIPKRENNRAVYALDVETKNLIMIWSYYQPD
jgi:hypothetical protein